MGSVIPKTYVHPTWWLEGAPITTSNWLPSELIPEPIETTALLQTDQLAYLHQQLYGSGRVKADQVLNRLQGLMVQHLQQQIDRQNTTVLPPDPIIQQRHLQPRLSHGPTNTRMLTANEIAVREQNRLPPSTAPQRQRSPPPRPPPVLPLRSVTPSPVLAPRPVTPSRVMKLVDRTPERPPQHQPTREPIPQAAPCHSPIPIEALQPPSTAPTATITTGKRQRRPTKKYEESVKALKLR